MGSEFLLYGYGFVCLSMLLFNIVYNTLMKGSQRRLERRSGRMEAQVESQLRRLRAGEPLEEPHGPAAAEAVPGGEPDRL